MRTRAKLQIVASDRARRENVPKHDLLCSQNAAGYDKMEPDHFGITGSMDMGILNDIYIQESLKVIL